MTTIQIGNYSLPIHVDTHGNLYLEYNDKMYQLNVDSNDKP